MYWFEDRRISAQLPLPLKCYSAYCRRMLDPSTGMVKGGSFLLRNLRKFRHLWGGHGDEAIRVGETTIVLDPYSEVASFALNEMMAGGDEVRVMRLAMSKGDTFLEVGANHGAFSVMASTMVGSEGAVIAFEPQPELAGFIRKSFEANHFRNGTVFQMALSDHEGEATFYIPVHSGFAGVYQGFSGKGSHKKINVPLARLDHQLKNMNVPGQLFIKLDVEGSELPFLCGAENTVRERRPLILMEINPDSAAAAGYTVADLIAKLKALGYSRLAEMDEYPGSFSIDDLSDNRLTQFRDIIAVPST
jgi:FkbM family methyltransferase